MLGLLRLLAETGAAAGWTICFIAAIVAVFMLSIGIAMLATYRAGDTEQREIRYKIFHDLLKIFGRGDRQ